VLPLGTLLLLLRLLSVVSLGTLLIAVIRRYNTDPSIPQLWDYWKISIDRSADLASYYTGALTEMAR